MDDPSDHKLDSRPLVDVLYGDEIDDPERLWDWMKRHKSQE